MKKILALAVLVLSLSDAGAQTRYLVKLRNKGFNTFSLANPGDFLSQRAIDRRTRYGIALDSTDLPVTQRYLDSIAAVPGVTILNPSKWLNQVSIRTTDANAIARINALPFVVSVNSISFRISGNAVGAPDKLAQPVHRGAAANARQTQVLADAVDYGQSGAQIRIHNGNFLHNIGLRGEGMIIGMLDAGYNNYLSVPSLDSVRSRGQILGIYDFVALDGTVNEDNAHGMECFSTIAANLPGTFVGSAFRSNFYLFRTEDAATETPIEEHNWACGAERIDSAGGDVISSSLGYYSFDSPFQGYNHPFSEMNGNTTMTVIAADLAAKKGLLVAAAAGNEGNNSWGRIITPADGDSVMAVGAVTYNGVAASFTSRGPSADGQVKPDMASVGVGTIIQYPGGAISGGNGTSFATPNLAGLATCLWQGFREFNNMKIIDALRQSGSRATNPNDSIGFGIPDVKKALIHLTADYATATATVDQACNIQLHWASKDVTGMQYRIERQNPGEPAFTTVMTIPAGNNAVFANSIYTTNFARGTGAAGTTTIRIRQVFDTDPASYADAVIEEVALSTGAGCTATAINTPTLPETGILLLPNPTRGNFAVRVQLPSATNDLQVQVTDASGKVIYRQKRALPAGTSLIPLQLGRLAAGKYFVTLYGNGQLLGTRELIKL
ncbi:T9SS type A sorting domain-containing protein [Flaviaesturariibacter flavus]|uniref:T9SS type A sorting domain-containing protein n=1 Tax=Flaviaesturariibacter flavus TaxID=2502780 RepID=A0A4R1B4K7_9BACT|nr:S8 family peptidase [Flaviaesturariibacter flavus]TCJ12400.1 T9SS type A sorting domain-containing protein [Flaviaesturariibacter flavus]